jgi:hypothetical protein
MQKHDGDPVARTGLEDPESMTITDVQPAGGDL